MKQQFFVLSFGLGIFLFLTQHLQAQTAQCGQRDAVLKRLQGQFGETVRSMGLGANNGIVEMHASDETGTWTLTMTLPNGMTCLMAAGQSYENVTEQTPAMLPGEDA